MNLLQRLMFSLWYVFRPPWDTGVSPPELLEFLDSNPPGRALDLGCGTGTNGITMAKRGWEVTGVDFAPFAIWQARRKAHAAGEVIDFRVGDVTRIDDVVGPFDLVLDIGCFHILSAGAQETYIRNLSRLLSPAGTFLLYSALRNHPEEGGPGLLETDLQRLADHFQIVKREDGLHRGTRMSVWMTYQSWSG